MGMSEIYTRLDFNEGDSFIISPSGKVIYTKMGLPYEWSPPKVDRSIVFYGIAPENEYGEVKYSSLSPVVGLNPAVMESGRLRILGRRIENFRHANEVSDLL